MQRVLFLKTNKVSPLQFFFLSFYIKKAPPFNASFCRKSDAFVFSMQIFINKE